MAELPDKVRIVSSFYKIKKIRLKDDFGGFCSIKQEITIDAGLPKPKESRVLYHELVHTILHEYGVELTEEEEEQVALAIEGGMVALAKDHSSLLINIIKDMKEA